MVKNTSNSQANVRQSEVITVLKRMFENDDIKAVRWEEQSPSGSATSWGGGAVIRLVGTAVVEDHPRSWSLIRKRLVPPQTRDGDAADQWENPSGIVYWKREYHFYQSGLLDGLPNGFAVPLCYHAEINDNECVLWQEEVRDEISTWSVDRFATAAQHLGHFNGLYLAERPLPEYPWLTRNIVQQKERRGEFLANLDKLRQHSIVRKGWPDDVADGIQRIWRERNRFYKILKQLPQTLYHGDARRRNLMSRTGKGGKAETVAIDWGMGGIGAVGEEIASTVFSSTYWFEDVVVAQLPELEKNVLEGYYEGLYQAGWRGDPELPYLGYLCAVALRYGPLIISPEVMSLGADKEQRAMMEKRFGWTIKEWAESLAQLRRFVIQRADKARLLMTEVEL